MCRTGRCRSTFRASYSSDHREHARWGRFTAPTGMILLTCSATVKCPQLESHLAIDRPSRSSVWCRKIRRRVREMSFDVVLIAVILRGIVLSSAYLTPESPACTDHD